MNSLFELLTSLNPWWSGQAFDTGRTRTRYFSKIQRYLETKEIIVLSGVRRSGKTTLLFQIVKHLITIQKVPPRNILFVNCDEQDISVLENAISNVVISGVAVDPSAYNTTVAGKITFTPAASTLLQTANTKQIMVNATGFPTEVVSQAIAAGAAAKLTVTNLPVADVLNVPFSIQPVVTIQDQFGNKIATSTASVTASAGTTDWTLGGTTTVAAVAGVCTFTDLTVTSSTNVPGAIINFNSAPLTSTSAIFNIGPTAVNEVIDNTVALIYTNADNRITVKCTNGISSESTVAVYNVTGQRLVSNRLTNNITVLNQSFQSGIYLVSVSNAGKTVTRRIVLN